MTGEHRNFASGLSIDGEEVRRWHATEKHDVTAEALAAYAAATNDFHDERCAGRLAPPTYACVPFFSSLLPFLNRLFGHRDIGRLIHLGQEFDYHAPILPGTELTTVSEALALWEGSLGAILKVRGATTDATGSLVIVQTATLMIREAHCVNSIGAPDPLSAPARHDQDPQGTAPPSPSRHRSEIPGTHGPETRPGTEKAAPRAVEARPEILGITVDADQPARYADASDDRNPIHMDPSAARRAGFPSIVLHGMCTLALACHTLERERQDLNGGKAVPVTALRAQFARPVFPNDRLTIRWREAEEPGTAGWVFDVLNRRRRAVLRAGWIAF